MLGSLWNRLTKFSILGFAPAIICLTLGITRWPQEGATLYFLSIAIVLLIVSIIIEGYGIYKARHFFREDAQEVYERVRQLIMDLRTLAPELHKEYDGMNQEHQRYIRDKRYKKLTGEFDKVIRRCNDNRLRHRLHTLIENEKLMAKYRLTGHKLEFKGTLENSDKDIISYINTVFRPMKN